MMIGGLGWVLASAKGRAANGFFRRNTRVASSGVSIASSRSATVCPSASRFIQRVSEAAQSFEVTLLPSWNTRPSRSFMVQRLPSSAMT